MTPEKFNQLGKRIYGDYGWQAKLAKATGYTAQAINNWARGRYAIPLIIQRFLEHELIIHNLSKRTKN